MIACANCNLTAADLEKWPAPDGCCDNSKTCPDCGREHEDDRRDGELCLSCKWIDRDSNSELEERV